MIHSIHFFHFLSIPWLPSFLTSLLQYCVAGHVTWSVLSSYCIPPRRHFGRFCGFRLSSQLQYLAMKRDGVCCGGFTEFSSSPYRYHRATYFTLLPVLTGFTICCTEISTTMHALFPWVSSSILQLLEFFESLSRSVPSMPCAL